MIIPQMEELYRPYSKDASLEKTMEWLMKQAAAGGVPDGVRDAVITEVFLEMAKGKTFPTDHCDCGCDFPVKWSCVAMNHYTLKRMLERKGQVTAAYNKVLQDALTTSILDHIHRENERYVAEQELTAIAAAAEAATAAKSGGASPGGLTPPNGNRHRLTDWSRSPVLRAMNRVIRWTGSLLAL